MKNILLFISITFALNTFSQTTLIPDPNFEQALIDLGYDTGSPDGTVLTANISSVSTLDVNSSNISDLTGIEEFTALTTLFCFNNQLTSLDVSQNTALTDLYCNANQLTSLDVSQNTALTFLWCFFNQLNCLNVKNGNNSNFTFLYANDNPNLTCIEVDDATYSTTNWTDIDAQTSFSTNCGNPCSLSISELNTNSPKTLSKIIDLTGRETPNKKNTVLLYIYEDGTAERVFDFE